MDDHNFDFPETKPFMGFTTLNTFNNPDPLNSHITLNHLNALDNPDPLNSHITLNRLNALDDPDILHVFNTEPLASTLAECQEPSNFSIDGVYSSFEQLQDFSQDFYEQPMIDKFGQNVPEFGEISREEYRPNLYNQDDELLTAEEMQQVIHHHHSPVSRRKRPRHETIGSLMESARPTSNDFIDTRAIVTEVSAQLKYCQISQTVFAERVLQRSQGTLSDLLKNPKPWDQMKSGKTTFIKMKEWLDLSMEEKKKSCAIDDYNSEFDEPREKRVRRTYDGPRSRFVFTSIQKNTLSALFNENPKPDARTKEIIAEKLSLDVRTVDNFFMNARRRLKCDDSCDEE